MSKPKYQELTNVDSWICCWCGTDNDLPDDVNDFDYKKGSGVAKCRKCGKENTVLFSIEFTSQPITE